MASRLAVVAAIVGSAGLLTGCHAGTSGTLAPRPEPSLPKMDVTTASAIKRHNQVAEKVHALQAKPEITFNSPGGGGSASGRMALERPRDFRLMMKATGVGQVADIGSNTDEFWFWAKARGKADNNVYVCSYEDFDRSPMPSAFQPDWIIEAMGLRPISLEEAGRMKIVQGDGTYGTVKLVSTRRGRSGETLTKETIVDLSGRIHEHRLYEGDPDGKKRTLLAYAVVEKYAPVSVVGSSETVELPFIFKLEWIPEQMSLLVKLDNAVVYPEFTADQRKNFFSEPTIPGTARVDLAQLQAPPSGSRLRASADPAATPAPRTRRSRSAPATGRDVELGSPESIDNGPDLQADDATVRRRSRSVDQ